MTVAQISTPTALDALRPLLDQVEDGLSAFLAREQVRRAEADVRGAIPVMEIAALAKAGGKRLRPMFCLSGYLAAGGVPADAPVRPAMALELLHIAALIHDDIMDDSDLRRGVSTTHAKHSEVHIRRSWRGEARRYGEAIGILAGDLAWVYADMLMAGLSPEATAEWFELRAELVVGQSLDVMAAAEFAADPELARHIAVVKSGRYTIYRPLVLGATLAGRSDLTPAFRVYGEVLGEAFQLRDDLIDAFGDGSCGKPAGLDFAQHKMTLLIALAMREDAEIRELVALGAFDELRVRLAGVRSVVEDHIADLVRQARAAISSAPVPTEWQLHLSAMAHKVAYRDC